MDYLTVIFSRLQFAFTAGYHFIFVPITLGMSLILAIMETVYVKTNNPIYKDMVKFWGGLLGLQIAMGVATGVPMEFQFGTNWSYYSHYVGDMFGVPLAIEGLMAFFLEATFLGIFFFGWDKISKIQHCVCTWMIFLGANLSGLWILVANGWMQHPAGAVFNPNTMRMELSSFYDLVLNPLVQNRFLHTLSSGYVTGALLVIAVSSIYLLINRKKYFNFAMKSIKIATIIGVISIAGLIFAGDDQGVKMTTYQPAKLAAIEALWETEEAPAAFNLVAIPNQKEMKNDFAIKIPWVLGLIDTHSLTTKIIGAKDIVKINEQRIKNGIEAYKALVDFKEHKISEDQFNTIFNKKGEDLGYGLLMKSYHSDITKSTEVEIKAAAKDTIPQSLWLFIAFRLMVGLGVLLLVYFVFVTVKVMRNSFATKDGSGNRFPLWFSIYMLPVPWLAIYCGWFVAEYGRQPWVIQDILPTFLGVSNLPSISVLASLIFFVLIYLLLMILNVVITIKFVKKGPKLNSLEERTV